MGKKDGKKSTKQHASLSEVQDEAEAVSLELLRQRDGYKTLARREIAIGNAKCQPDGVNALGTRIVEIYAHVGKLRGAQDKKVAKDILKFAAIQRQPNRERTKCEIWFVDEEARRSVTGWMKEAAAEFEVQLRLVTDFPETLRKDLIKAQERQATGTAKKPAKGKS